MSQLTSPTIKWQCIAEFLGIGLLIFFSADCVAAMKHVTDYTNASRTMLFNIHELEWGDCLLNIMDIPRSHAAQGTTLLGNLRPDQYRRGMRRCTAICV